MASRFTNGGARLKILVAIYAYSVNTFVRFRFPALMRIMIFVTRCSEERADQP